MNLNDFIEIATSDFSWLVFCRKAEKKKSTTITIFVLNGVHHIFNLSIIKYTRKLLSKI